MEPVYSKTGGLRPPQWPPYMPPTPPIPHEYCSPSPGSPSHSNLHRENLDSEASRRKRRVRFSDSIKVRILFSNSGEGDRELVIDTELVDAFWFVDVVGFGRPIRVVVVALTSWMSYSLGTVVPTAVDASICCFVRVTPGVEVCGNGF